MSKYSNSHIAVLQRCSAAKAETFSSDIGIEKHYGDMVVMDSSFVNRAVRRRIKANERKRNKKLGS